MSNAYVKEYEVQYRDSDYKLRCKISSLIYFLCDVGNAHAEDVGDTIQFLMDHRCGWVFYKYDIHINKYPTYRDKVIIETKPAGFRKFYALRDYVVKSESGEVFATATALFFLIDIDKRRPMRILEEQYKAYGVDGDVDKIRPIDKIEKLTEENFYKEFQIRYSDIDSNTHVNNVKYVEWALESVPQDVINKYELKRMNILFEKETRYGNRIHVSAQIKEEENGNIKTLHKIVDKDGEELTLLELEWENR